MVVVVLVFGSIVNYDTIRPKIGVNIYFAHGHNEIEYIIILLR